MRVDHTAWYDPRSRKLLKEFSNVFDECLPPDNVRGWVCIGAVISPHAMEQLLSEPALRFTPCPTVNRNQLFQGCRFGLLLHAHCLLIVVLRKTPRPRGMLNEAQRQPSAAPGSGSAADTGGRRLDAVVRCRGGQGPRAHPPVPQLGRLSL